MTSTEGLTVKLEKNICIANSVLALKLAFACAVSVVFLHKILYFCF